MQGYSFLHLSLKIYICSKKNKGTENLIAERERWGWGAKRNNQSSLLYSKCSTFKMDNLIQMLLYHLGSRLYRLRKKPNTVLGWGKSNSYIETVILLEHYDGESSCAIATVLMTPFGPAAQLLPEASSD